MARTIALFGGSFDPPHLGHVLCATWAQAVSGADEVWVLPVARHRYDHKRALLPWEARWALCQAAFGDLGFCRLRDDELGNPSGSTFDLLSRLRPAHPDVRWLLVGGTDTQRDLPNWHRGDELLRLVEVVAVPRRGFDAGDHALPCISSTEVRRRLAAGEPVDGLLPRRVADLIHQQGWYAG